MGESPKHTIIVTGAAGGIGFGFLYAFLNSPLAASHHGIYVAHPSEQDRLEKLLDTHAPPSHSAEIYVLDLSRLAAVRKFAKQIRKKVEADEIPRVRSLYLIAGGIFTRREEGDGIDYSIEGWEMMFAVNYLANFVIVLSLLGCMQEKGRVVFVASTTHDPANRSNYSHVKKEEHRLVWRDVEVLAKGTQEVVGTTKRERFEAAMRRYGASKMLLVMFMYELQSRLDQDPALSGIAVLAMDPGAVGGTGLIQPHTFPLWLWFILKFVIPIVQGLMVVFLPDGPLRTPQQVGKDLVIAGYNAGLKGGTYLDGQSAIDSSPESHDKVKQDQLWEGSLKLVGLKQDETVLKLP